MNNLRKFSTEAEYSAATLNYPAVSWVVSGDTVHYDKEVPTPTPPAPTLETVMADDSFDLSTPIYRIETMWDTTYLDEENTCTASLSDGSGNTYHYNAAFIESEVATLSLNGQTVASNLAGSSIDIYATLGHPLYLLDKPFYTKCSEWSCPDGCEECTGWWDDETGECVDWDTGGECCEPGLGCNCPEECTNEETYYQCEVDVPASNNS